MDQSYNRALQFTQELLQRHGDSDDRVAIITHGGFTAMILRVLFRIQGSHNLLGTEMNTWISANNTAITRIDHRDNSLILTYQNRVAHLPTNLIT
jgi:2,3-bisphosphoglycerate-dependent phosphoglycerate mutase